ncbi:aryl-alcohol dehydrogenase-like predicted oxidoreductase [Actinocorallia herbida]|uniref:Aryl-alcohol dehydrogenase-like predicted oxidoreductase n=1 Tax=Actinocorallia herbida TaxID=58109 RepID=A0A3N1D2A0_9ACTN|nr:aldo/keto reductase [Actinocorallia herbida]ROO87664.1 aryl-alcohol dehydrogenase-like predicted oxidoreductase [Actinocorallia herbida]
MSEETSGARNGDGMILARTLLGGSGISVRPVGLGLMGMSQFYGAADPDGSVATIRDAIEEGVELFDTSDYYGASSATPGGPVAGFGHNEELLGRALKGRRDRAVVATKFSARPTPEGRSFFDGRPEYVKAACEASLGRLGTDRIDLYYYHRLDPAVPVEDTVGAMGELVAEGKVRAIGLSEVGPEILRRAHAVHPVAALQSEYSLWERGVEAEVLPECRRLGVTLVPYSPLGRGMLTGAFRRGAVFGRDDFRSTLPKFQGENFEHNLLLVEELERFAETIGATAGQIALTWLLSRHHDIVPIPGSRRLAYVRANLAATSVRLSADDVARLDALFDPALVSGGRYGALNTYADDAEG